MFLGRGFDRRRRRRLMSQMSCGYLLSSCMWFMEAFLDWLNSFFEDNMDMQS